MHNDSEDWREHEGAKLIRISEVLRRIPVSRSTWWEGVRTGLYPEPVKLGPKITCWHLSKINKLISEGIDRK